jgi:hypothetical protein
MLAALDGLDLVHLDDGVVGAGGLGVAGHDGRVVGRVGCC